MSPYDPLSLVAVPTLLLAAAVVAIVKPAHDAISVDPAVALRDE